MSNEKQKQNIRQRLAVMEKEIFGLSGNERVRVRTEYHKLLHCYRKECGLDEPIYLTRT